MTIKVCDRCRENREVEYTMLKTKNGELSADLCEKCVHAVIDVLSVFGLQKTFDTLSKEL